MYLEQEVPAVQGHLLCWTKPCLTWTNITVYDMKQCKHKGTLEPLRKTASFTGSCFYITVSTGHAVRSGRNMLKKRVQRLTSLHLEDVGALCQHLIITEVFFFSVWTLLRLVWKLFTHQLCCFVLQNANSTDTLWAQWWPNCSSHFSTFICKTEGEDKDKVEKTWQALKES